MSKLFLVEKKSLDLKSRRIAVVIAVHNRIAFTRRCLDSLRLSSIENEVVPIVIDDGSTDETRKIIREEYPEVIILNGDGNLWFGGATQLGIDTILNSGIHYDYIMTLNNDTFLNEGALDSMVIASAGIMVVAACYLEEDTGKVSSSGFKWRTTRGLIGATWLPEWAEVPPRSFIPVDEVATTVTLFPIHLLRKASSINLRLHPHNRYDVLLSSAVRKAGGKFLVSTEVLAKHIFGVEMRNRSCRYQNFREFWHEAFCDPLKVNYLPGSLDSIWKSAPNLLQAVMITIRKLVLFFGQLLYVALKTMYLYMKGRRTVN
jgi:GT2 family glycosyltransferase